jgi:hypothetical protein
MKTGKGGLVFNDRELAAKVRTLTLNECKFWLENRKSKMYKLVLGNLSRSVLPRMNEITGENGGPLVIELPKEIVDKNGLHPSTKKHSD